MSREISSELLANDGTDEDASPSRGGCCCGGISQRPFVVPDAALDYDFAAEFADRRIKPIVGGRFGLFRTRKGETLLTARFVVDPQRFPEGPVAVVVHHHGIQGYTHEWTEAEFVDQEKVFFNRYTSKGINVYTYDEVGHGYSQPIFNIARSEDCKHLIPELQDTLDNYEDFYKLVEKEVAAKYSSIDNLFIHGHSWGGLLTVMLGLRWQDRSWPLTCKGVILSCPAVKADLPALPVRLFLQHILAPCMPTFVPFFMPHPVQPSILFKDPRWESLLLSNPYCSEGSPFRLGTARVMLETLIEANARLSEISYPFVVVHARDDKACLPEGTEKLLAEAKSKVKDVFWVEGQPHNWQADTEDETGCVAAAEQAIVGWIENRIA